VKSFIFIFIFIDLIAVGRKSTSIALCIIQATGNEVSRHYLKVNIFPLLDVVVTKATILQHAYINIQHLRK
jgi:hypothetical protein